MRIRITAELPVAPEICPEVGSVHEVLEHHPLDPKTVKSGATHIYYIKAGITRIGVLNFECEITEP